MAVAYQKSPLTVVMAKPGVVTRDRLRNLDNWRALIHQVTPVVVTVLTTLSITTNDQAALWVSLFFAILDPLLSYARATDKARQIMYGVLGLAQSGGLLATVLMVAPPTAVPVISASVTVLTAVLARFYTPTSTMLPKPGVTVTKPALVIPNSPWPV